ncbi:hypothetical protein IHV09_11725 [Fictibacillus sp. 23RED33]|uniref:hypothetical protein n=1 Tax=Fictibacillus sp. 23RED33 TaxID=2745879 RepID=UPI0018CEE1A7|nr:hypothetical protein [Fictibacillus sp. 23RED33]MBH0174233.1 hypothetical protein [Fictibacillus sp. 23RED33]
MKQALYVVCIYFIICLFLLPFLTFTNWLILTSTLLLLAFIVGYTTFRIRKWWISFTITAALVTLYVYLINNNYSMKIPVHVVFIIGLIYLIIGVSKQLRNKS